MAKETKKRNNKVQNKEKGITLIALVITIIVILILAGVSINTLFGDNGLLTKADEARTANERAGAYDKVATEVLASYDNDGTLNEEILRNNLKARGGDVEEGSGFPVKVTMNNYPFKIDAQGNIGDTLVAGVEIPSGYTQVNPTAKKEDGIVIKDSKGNEYVWIPVPKTEEVYKTAKLGITNFSDKDYKSIETDLKNYSNVYNTTGFNSKGDEWYAWDDDKNSIITGETTNEKEKELTNGCGLNYNDYYELKKRMLKSIYQKGGFWIGRYEAGIEGKIKSEAAETEATPRMTHSNITDNSPKAVSQPNKYLYNYVTIFEAQELASKMNIGGELTSSLMFGVQWNLVCKFLATRLGDEAVKTNSSSWGNYADVSFTIDRGEYLANPESEMNSTWQAITVNMTDYVTEQIKQGSNGSEKGVLLTTGASDRNCQLNIYDFAGNEQEFTLEMMTDSKYPCSLRGGCYVYTGSSGPASYRYNYVNPLSSSSYAFGFRVALY